MQERVQWALPSDVVAGALFIVGLVCLSPVTASGAVLRRSFKLELIGFICITAPASVLISVFSNPKFILPIYLS